MARKSKKDRKGHCQSLMRAVRERLAHMDYVFVDGKRYAPDAVLARLQVLLDDMDRTNDAYHAWVAALVVERRRQRDARSFLRSLGDLLAGAIGPYSPAAKALGVGRRKTGPKTVAVKLQAAQKAAATRELRGTKKRRRTG